MNNLTDNTHLTLPSCPEDQHNHSERHTKPSLIDAVIPLLVLACLLVLSVSLFGDSSSQGANQIGLLLSSAVAAIIGIKNGWRWPEIEAAITIGITHAVGALLILLTVGSLIGAWILSGTVPTMIYYGLALMNPIVFYAATCAICALAALSVGSSWSVIGTLGVGLIGIGASMGLSQEITAGAIICGAYFGDKMSPLSDTTNLAPAIAGTDLMTHIRHMMWTTGPAIIISLVLFLLIGYNENPVIDQKTLATTQHYLTSTFIINPFMLLPMLVVFLLVLKKVAALPSLFAGIGCAVILACLCQQKAIGILAGNITVLADGALLVEDTIPALTYIKTNWQVLFEGYQSQTGNANLDELLSRGGMRSMLPTIWLILSAMVFGSVLEALGMLQCILEHVMRRVRSTGALIASTIATCIGTNLITADQYISLVLPGRMYRLEFYNRGLHAKNLSRTLEDAGTITSVLIPWNTCGAYASGLLGVATLAYLPFCFFNLINPIVSLLYGMTGFTIVPIEKPVNEKKAADNAN